MEVDHSCLKLRKDVPSGTIVMEAADRRNALTRNAVASLQLAFEDFQREKSVRAIILTGAGNCFCAGTDLKEIQSTSRQPDAQQQWQADVDQQLLLLETMLRCPKPILAAVNGPALGLGVALVLACDLVIAAPQATLVLPENHRGLVPGMTAPLLAFRAGAGIAAWLTLSGGELDAAAAHTWRVVHEVVAEPLLWARSHEIAKQIAAGAHQSTLLTKKMLNEVIGESLLTQLNIGAAHTAAARTTEAAEEGVQAFLEKRSAEFP